MGHAERVAVREGRVPRVRGARPDRRREPGPHRDEGGGALRAGILRADRPWCTSACGGAAPQLDLTAIDELFATRIAEADEFYGSITPAATPADEAVVMRQALAGMLWGKQLYFFDLDRWLEEHHVHPLRDRRRHRSATGAGST